MNKQIASYKQFEHRSEAEFRNTLRYNEYIVLQDILF